MDQNCIFCKIVKGEIPSTKVYEDEKSLVLVDINPVNIGHLLAIPKEHFENIYETPEEIMAHLMKICKRLSSAIKKAMNADGVNITMNNEPSAGQIIMHSHVHVIPRFKDDGFGTWHGKRPYNDGEKEEVAEKIKKEL